MVGGLSSCYLVTYETEPANVARHLPPGLRPALHGGKAHWGIVLSIVDKMRPKGLPRLLGSTYTHLALRAYAEANDADGVRHEGLHFLRSDVDDALMALGGNVMTDFRFHRARIRWQESEAGLEVDCTSKDGLGDCRFHLRTGGKPAREHLQYQPWGLSVGRGGRVLRLAEVRRDEARWNEEPMKALVAESALLRQLDPAARLVEATRVAPLPYEWRIGGRRRLA